MKKTKGLFALTALVLAGACLFSACGGSSDAYSAYESAYKKVTEKGGLEADFDVSLKIDNDSVNSKGNFKLDNSGDTPIMLYTMTVNGGNEVTQFSDGQNIYTEADGHKTMFSINGNHPDAGSDSPERQAKDSASSVFDTVEFMQEFSSFMEAGKIRELGLLDPIPKLAVTKTEKSGSTYTLTLSESKVDEYLNTMVANQVKTSSGETLKIEKLEDLSYQATESNGVISNVKYGGTLEVVVPASLMSSGEETTYNMDFVIDMSYVNPGSAVTVELPSTDGFEPLG